MTITITSSLADLVAAISTSAAAGVAVWAVLSANRTTRQTREHQRLDERHRDCVALLAAYEEIQTLREFRDIESQDVEEYTAAGERDAENEALKLAHARCVALIRASPEPLPITRGSFFNHVGIPFEEDIPADELDAYLMTAPEDGDPEFETLDVRRCRGEIVQTIERLRERLSE